jgi:hypothetical protein
VGFSLIFSNPHVFSADVATECWTDASRDAFETIYVGEVALQEKVKPDAQKLARQIATENPFLEIVKIGSNKPKISAATFIK